MSDNPRGGSPEGGKSRPPRARSVDGDRPNAARPFGCPYYKHDPSRNNECKAEQTLKGTGYVKRHLQRYHQQPIHCPMCGETFNQQSTRDDHIRERLCGPRRFTHEGMTQHQVESLEMIPRMATESERWNMIWDILFPGEPPPDSPYVDEPAEKIERLHPSGLDQRRRGSSSTTAPKHDATTDRDFRPEAFKRRKGFVRARQQVTYEESGFTMTPSHPEPTFIDGLQFAKQPQGDQRGHPPPTHLESWLTPEKYHRELLYPEDTSHATSEPSAEVLHALNQYRADHPSDIRSPPEESYRKTFYPEDTSHATSEPSAYAEFLPDTTPYPVGYQPDHGFLSPNQLESINDSTVGYTAYDDVAQSHKIPGSAMDLDEDSRIDWPPRPHLPKVEPGIHATSEPSAEVLRELNQYRADHCSDIGSPPGPGFLSPDQLEPINDLTVGYTGYDDVAQSHNMPGLAMGLEEDSGIDWPPPPHLLKVEPGTHAAGPSEHAESLFHVSRFASHESRRKARDQKVDDKAIIYSMESISPESRGRYITALSSRLAEDICKVARNITVPPGSGELLLEWMKIFAMKLQGEASTVTRREASVFIRRYRRDIVEKLACLPLGQPAEQCSDDDEGTPGRPSKKLKRTIGEWLGGLHESEDPETSSVIGDDDDECPLPNIVEYEQFILESDAYKWLISKIECHAQLEVLGHDGPADIGGYIRAQILSQPSLRNVSRRSPTLRVELCLSLDWDPREFIKDQEYSMPPEKVFDHIICLTGTWKNAQAMTVAEYMEQTWPLTYEPLRYLMKQALTHTQEATETYTFKNSSSLKYHQRGSHCRVMAIGQVDFVSEIADQLAWLASTLRPSPVPVGVVACRPTISSFKVDEQVMSAGRRISISALCKLEFLRAIAQEISPSTPGFCWANLFRNPLLVTGYPIRRRATPDTGVEISLRVMAELVQSRQLTGFGEKIMIKGFSSLLVATAVLIDTVTWHLFFNPSGGRISYCDARAEEVAFKMPEDFILRELESRRHIVGWCSDVGEYTGCSAANYAVKASNLPKPPASIGIKKLYLEGGASAVFGGMIDIGKKDKPIHMSRGSRFTDLLAWVAEQPMVLYDSGDRRAWLVDGASALLHLVRASLKRDQNNPVYQSRWCFNGTLSGESPVEILTNLDNLNIKLFVEDRRPTAGGGMEDVYCYFRDRVQDILRNLDVLIDYQVQAAARDGYWFHQSGPIIKKTAVGFDFWDVAKPAPSITRRYHALDTWGYGWVDYIRSIGATIIFGNDLGELVRPETAGPCPSWASVQTGQDLLCTSIRTLKTISATMGTCLGEGKLTSDMLWSSRSPLFTKCPCLSLHPGAVLSHVDPIQLLLPRKKIGKISLDAPNNCIKVTLAELQDLGAVVFGHTPYYKAGRGLKYVRSSRKDKRSVDSQSSTESNEGRMDWSASNSSGLEYSTDLTSPLKSPVGSKHESSEGEESPEEARVSTGAATGARPGARWFKGLRSRR